MIAFLAAWVVLAILASFAALALVVGLEIHDHRRTADRPVPDPVPATRIPAQRPPTAAAVVTVHDTAAFDEFLRELILTTHVEAALS